jgi:branched-chain amino acid transport system permease protein
MLLCALFPFYAGPYFISLSTTVLTYVTLVAAWNIISGYAGYIFLGSAAFYGTGMYINAVFGKGFTIYGAILLAFSLAFAIGFGLGYPFLRLRGTYFVIATLALSELIKNIITYVEIRYTQTVGRFTVLLPHLQLYYLMLIITVITVLVCAKLRSTKFGLGLLAIKNDEDAAKAMGVPTLLYKLSAFGLSAAIMAAAGAVMGSRVGYIDPTFAFSSNISLFVLVMGYLGQPGNILGGVITATFLALVFEIFLTTGQPYPFGVLLAFILLAAISGKLRTLMHKLSSHLSLLRSRPL